MSQLRKGFFFLFLTLEHFYEEGLMLTRESIFLVGNDERFWLLEETWLGDSPFQRRYSILPQMGSVQTTDHFKGEVSMESHPFYG